MQFRFSFLQFQILFLFLLKFVKLKTIPSFCDWELFEQHFDFSTFCGFFFQCIDSLGIPQSKLKSRFAYLWNSIQLIFSLEIGLLSQFLKDLWWDRIKHRWSQITFDYNFNKLTYKCLFFSLTWAKTSNKHWYKLQFKPLQNFNSRKTLHVLLK